MRRFIYIFVVFLSCAACDVFKKDTPTPDTGSEITLQTTLMYLTGTNLSYYFGQNITAASTAIAQDALGDGRFLVFMHDSSTSASLVEYKYQKGVCVAETLKEYDYIVSLTQDAITEVVADVKDLAPAESYNLIISGHATGWVPKDRQADWSKASTFSISESTSDIDWEAMATSPFVTRYLGGSEDSFFDISELQASLEATGTHFGYILFDECFNSSIELLYDLRNLCDYIVASPCEIMGNGFPYDTIIPKLFSDNGATADLQGVCEEYVNYYTTYSISSGCVALTVTAELDALAEITRQINSDEGSIEVDPLELQAYERLSNPLFLDFEQYMLARCTNESLAAAFTAQMELAFPVECRLHTDRFFANIGVSASSANNYDAYYTTIEYYSGVTTSAPSTRMEDEWAATSWTIATN
ncbi:MAG: clostripain-related cysteine peptidase [Rikenellaceae bacterium]